MLLFFIYASSHIENHWIWMIAVGIIIALLLPIPSVFFIKAHSLLQRKKGTYFCIFSDNHLICFLVLLMCVVFFCLSFIKKFLLYTSMVIYNNKLPCHRTEVNCAIVYSVNKQWKFYATNLLILSYWAHLLKSSAISSPNKLQLTPCRTWQSLILIYPKPSC